MLPILLSCRVIVDFLINASIVLIIAIVTLLMYSAEGNRQNMHISSTFSMHL